MMIGTGAGGALLARGRALDALSGVARLGSEKNPTGHVPIDFTDGSFLAIYKLDDVGNVNLHTLYPNPKSQEAK
ncbi:hypothetical protein [Allohahella marinimesophila]|uniref:hypothetical protein n=1 Tax=Allohahella marinimesophila TaxID=1054972 RepID=UPI0031D3FB64